MNHYLWPLVPMAALASLSAVAQQAVQERCQALTNADFSGIQDAPTQLIEAALTPAAAQVPAYCNVRGYVTPNVGIELKLPVSGWNGKFLHIGCGGLCGVLFSSYSKNAGHDCDQGLRKGYACIASNQGHQGTMVEGKWAYNNLQAQLDYAYRATHVATLAGKAITERFYSRAPQKSYFWGCSGGGRQGLVAAQKFPWDFDGIVAVAPGIHLSGVLMTRIWNTRVATEAGRALFNAADVERLHAAVVARCDMTDGLKDGIIGDPLGCTVNPSEWICAAGATANDACISEKQARALAKIYAGPTNAAGLQIHTGGFVPGLENNIPTTAEVWMLPADYFRYMGFMPAPGPAWHPDEFDFDRDPQRMALAQALLDDANPDLRRFKSAGGKLILAHGWGDALSPLNTIDYYQTAERTMGGAAATREFFRLFMVTGMGHCSGGAGAYAIDYLSYLEDWAERGRAPEMMLGAHIKEERYTGWEYKLPADPADVSFTRPIHPYPIRTHYRGKGDRNDARSFRPLQPQGMAK